MGSTAILARLLAPEHFGFIAMVMAFTGLASLFEEMGLSTATIQKKEINHQQISTLFWINISLGLIITFSVIILTPVICLVYHEPQLKEITYALATTLFISSLATQHRALLRRQMRFATLSIIEIFSQAAGIVAAIFLAWQGASFWALVWMNITNKIFNVLGVWLSLRWVPGLPVRNSGIGSFIKFGGNLTAGNFLNYCMRQLDKILIGAVWGAGSVGLYSKAYQLLMLPIRQINGPMGAVAIPALSRLQNEPERFRHYYCKGISLMTSIGMPIVAFTFVEADKLVLLFLGDQWVAVTPLFRALAPSAFIGTFNVVFGWIFIPLGLVERQLRFLAASTVITIFSFLVGLPWGAYGVALAFSIQAVLKRIPQIIYTFHGTPLKLGDLGKILWQPAITSVGAAFILAALSPLQTYFSTLFIQIIFDFTIYCTVYLLLNFLLPQSKERWFELVNLVSTLLKKSVTH